MARKPQQQRAKERVDTVLQEAEVLLVEGGVSGFSIPRLAERLDFPRATIYKFFPTPWALLNELAERELAALEARLDDHAEALREARDWRETVTRMVYAAADFYDERPVAQVVLLTGFSDDSFRALEYTIARLGALTRSLLHDRGIVLPDGAPDIPALAVEFGTASFRMSYFLHGRMTPEYTQAAAEVMLLFLEKRLQLTA
ncbi:TetR/AcrR family transcriptional regulator [Algiphilus sp.]|uniref:TetR/AcrR family transcriptional regulator n=1 Tax=Algiphilus sp. TaxID=1872431 RepID=UPI003C33050F